MYYLFKVLVMYTYTYLHSHLSIISITQHGPHHGIGHRFTLMEYLLKSLLSSKRRLCLALKNRLRLYSSPFMVVRLFRQVLCVGLFLAYLSGFIVCVCTHTRTYICARTHTRLLFLIFMKLKSITRQLKLIIHPRDLAGACQ